MQENLRKMKDILLFLMLIIIFSESSASRSDNIFKDDYSDYNVKIYRKYIKMDKKLKEIAELSVKKLLPYLLEAAEHVNISSSCTKNLFHFITGFRKLTNWSFNFLDAMGKMQSGYLTGNFEMVGEYEECMETIATKKGKVDFQGQYCSIACKPFLPKLKKIPSIHERIDGLINATKNTSDIMKKFVSKAHFFYLSSMHVGVCVPSGCSKQDISEIVKYLLRDYMNATVNHCIRKEDIFFWTRSRVITVFSYVLLGMLVTVSTLLDNTVEKWKNDKLGLGSRIFQCFSLSRNFPNLVSTAVSEQWITCLPGIRVLSIFWVVLANGYFVHASCANHGVNYEKKMTSFFSQIAMNGFISIDIFLFISGFVNSYSRTLIKKEEGSQPSALKLFLHKFWRIYSIYITVILAFLLVTFFIEPQPYMYPKLERISKICQRNWWKNLLLISNFSNPLNVCLAQTWLLCVDMQLFLVSLLTIPVLFKKPKQGIFFHVSIILIANLCSMSWWLVDDVFPSIFDGTSFDESVSVKSFHMHTLPAAHVGPYFIGIILGYIIGTKKERKIPKIIQLFGWLAASFLFTSMIFVTLKWNSGVPYKRLESSLYGAWSRTLMVLGFSWLLLCSVTGHARLINYILSLKLWIPLSRITYLIYFVSAILQIYYFISLSSPAEFSDLTIIWNYFAVLFISILTSFALALTVDSPIVSIGKIIFQVNPNELKTLPEVPK